MLKLLLFSYPSYSQIWLNYRMHDVPIQLMKKKDKKKRKKRAQTEAHFRSILALHLVFTRGFCGKSVVGAFLLVGLV